MTQSVECDLLLDAGVISKNIRLIEENLNKNFSPLFLVCQVRKVNPQSSLS